MIIATGPSPLTNPTLASISRLTMIAGKVNANVFPEPVNAIPIMSLPEKAVGIP
jgi:hypothetical protein